MPKREDNRDRIKRTNVAIPTIIVPGVDKRAASLGMSRSAYVSHVLIAEQANQGLERLERSEKRIQQLEAKLTRLEGHIRGD